MKKELQSKDLRIGNLVERKETSEVIEIIVISQNTVRTNRGTLPYNCLQPIPLTEDLCKQHISFKSRRDESYMYDIFEDEYGFHFVIDTYRDCHEIMRITKKIKFVHEWQNLYFAITDNELILEFTNP